MGWTSKRNGELLQLMVAARFDALLTVDQSLEFQQNVRAAGIGVVVANCANESVEGAATARAAAARSIGQGRRGGN